MPRLLAAARMSQRSGLVPAPRRRRLSALGVLAAGAVIVLAAGCQGTGPAPSDGRITVVATTTVFADLVSNVGGNLVSVSALVPKNGDVHTFEPRPSDIRAVAQAQLLVMNGLGLDGWLERTITNASAQGTPLLKLGEGLPGITLLPGETSSTENPHLWMDVAYAELYVDRIAASLAQVDPAHAATYHQQADAYNAQLKALDAEIRTRLASIPEANRRIVTFHPAFPYYARAYGITVVGTAVQAPGQEPSAQYTAQLIDAVRSQHVRAIFSEAQFPANLVDQLSAETGVRVVANLYDGSLGDPPVTSYIAMLRWDTQQIADALQ
jgi:ABC-type Zn uptake system ZnuABC Zn-binding protein ZnuA